MNYYINGQKIKIDTSKKEFDKGSEGKIYKIDNTLYKIYYPEQLNEGYGEKEKFHSYLQTIATKQIILPQDLIFQEDGKYVGYTTPFIPHDKKNKTGITKLDSKSFIKNLKILEEDTDILSNNYILQADVSPINYIFSKDSGIMNIIDPGRYRNHTKEFKYIYHLQNNIQLKKLIELLLLLDFYEFKPIGSKRKSQLLKEKIMADFNLSKEDRMSDFFEKELKSHETVESYVKSLGKYIK